MKCIALQLLFCFFSSFLFGQDKTKSIDSLLRTYYKDNEPGAVVTISKNNQVVYKKGFGLANLQLKQQISSSTNFNVGSITKQFTAFCVLQLAEKKQLSLQDKLVKFFPDFNATIGNQVTVLQLLTHSSGIIDHYAFTDTSKVKHATDKDVLAAIKNTDSTYFTPGTKYRYSNTAYCLLALIIEKLSGLSYREYVKRHILSLLSMQHSAVLQVGKPVYQQAYGYDRDSSSQPFHQLDAAQSIFFSTEGDGGLYTSADEYLRWWQSLQQPSASNKKIVTQQRKPQVLVDTLNRLSYGYGWFISEKDPEKSVYHSGSNGGFRAMVFTIPGMDYMVCIFSNRTGIDLEELVQQINNIEGVTNNSFTKIEALVSFIDSSPIFAPCKEIL